jgi:cell wall-associated NlpC family hydrolase
MSEAIINPRFLYTPRDPAHITREDVVEVARSLKGVRFEHQGSNPETGLDCRGVIKWTVYALAGRPIPLRDYQRRPSGAEFLEEMRTEMREKDKADVRNGDAVLMHFPRDTEARHGGIVAQGPYELMLIHAWESRGDGEVREEPLRGWKLRNIDYAFSFPFIGD